MCQDAGKAGAAFEEQIVRRIPAQRHDVSMNYILTPTCWLEAPRQIAVQS
jgi:5-formyltetrahydrofolate cyclo-ligase